MSALAELHVTILHQLFTGVADKVQGRRWQRIEALLLFLGFYCCLTSLGTIIFQGKKKRRKKEPKLHKEIMNSYKQSLYSSSTYVCEPQSTFKMWIN